jgi:PAS domain S-box-containing protein
MDNEKDSSVLQLLTEVIPLAIFLVDAMGRVSGWTGSAEKLLGYSEPDAIGRRFDELFKPAKELIGVEARAIELAGRAAYYKEIGLATRADGSRFLAIYTMDRIKIDRNDVTGYACTLAPV